MLMSEIEIITDGGRRRRWPLAEKLRIVEETMYDGASISAVARRNGEAPNLLYRWRELMLEGGSIAVAEDDSVTRCPAGDLHIKSVERGNKTVREMENRIRELERQLGRNTMEVEILKEALEKSRSKKALACAVVETGRFPKMAIATTMGVSRSNLHDRLSGSAKPRRSYHKA